MPIIEYYLHLIEVAWDNVSKIPLREMFGRDAGSAGANKALIRLSASSWPVKSRQYQPGFCVIVCLNHGLNSMESEQMGSLDVDSRRAGIEPSRDGSRKFSDYLILRLSLLSIPLLCPP